MEDYNYVLIGRIFHSNTDFVPYSFFCPNQHWFSLWEISTFIGILLCCISRLENEFCILWHIYRLNF